ncbi:hypothetical protein [Streptomyces adustus]
MNILALRGSLRSGSLDAAVPRPAAGLFVEPWEITVDPDPGRPPS